MRRVMAESRRLPLRGGAACRASSLAGGRERAALAVARAALCRGRHAAARRTADAVDQPVLRRSFERCWRPIWSESLPPIDRLQYLRSVSRSADGTVAAQRARCSSTSTRTCSTICWSRPIGARWRILSRRGRRFLIPRWSSMSPDCRMPTKLSARAHEGDPARGLRGSDSCRDSASRQDGFRRPVRPVVPRHSARAAARFAAVAERALAGVSVAAYVHRLVERHESGEADLGLQLWTLLSFEIVASSAARVDQPRAIPDGGGRAWLIAASRRAHHHPSEHRRAVDSGDRSRRRLTARRLRDAADSRPAGRRRRRHDDAAAARRRARGRCRRSGRARSRRCATCARCWRISACCAHSVRTSCTRTWPRPALGRLAACAYNATAGARARGSCTPITATCSRDISARRDAVFLGIERWLGRRTDVWSRSRRRSRASS